MYIDRLMIVHMLIKHRTNFESTEKNYAVSSISEILRLINEWIFIIVKEYIWLKHQLLF